MATRRQALSDDARALAGSHFGAMGPKGRVSIPDMDLVTDRARAALEELVDKGLIAFSIDAEGTHYSPLQDCGAHMRWHRRNLGKGRFTMLRPADPALPAP